MVGAEDARWSWNLLLMQVENRLLERTGTVVTSFEASLPKPDSDLARESFKDPYRLDFLGLGAEAHEREIGAGLIEHVTAFLLKLGAGFAFVGRQVSCRWAIRTSTSTCPSTTSSSTATW